MKGVKFTTGHVGLNVTDLPTSKSFYQKVFDFETIGESKSAGKLFVFLGYGDDIVVTLWQQGKDSFSKSAPGLHHLSFCVGSLGELQKAKTVLEKIGAKFEYEGVVAHREGSTSGGIFFEDPDGIRLEIYTDGLTGGTAAPHGAAPSCGFF